MLEKLWREGNPLTLLVGIQPLWKTVRRFLKNWEIELPYHPAVALLGIYPKDTNRMKRAICTPMFIAAVFSVAKLWKEPRCPSTD